MLVAKHCLITHLKCWQSANYNHTFYAVIADEATDIAQFVTNGLPCEKFVGFHRCVTGVSGQALPDNTLKMLAECQLQPHLLRGQAYDGAGAMAELLLALVKLSLSTV